MVHQNNNRGGKKLSRPARNVNLVLTAMRNLDNVNGSTVGNIVNYISNAVEKPASKREIIVALKRGVEFGLMDRKRSRFFYLESEKHQSRVKNQGGITSEQLERGARLRSRNTDGRQARENKSKDSPRRRRRGSRKRSGRRSVKKTRFARSLRTYDLSDGYKNLNNKPSAVSSIDSLEYWEGEDRRYWN